MTHSSAPTRPTPPPTASCKRRSAPPLRGFAAARALLALAAIAAAPDLPDRDIRTLRAGMTQAELPAEGFADFHCTAGNADLSGWADWRRCQADADGLHRIGFRYAEGRTLVGGHPVVMTAGLAGDGRLAVLSVVTDDSAPLFMRKKAFLLGEQARAHYGADGWTCTDLPPDATAEPVGGTYMRQTCRKPLDGRTVTLERNLYRRPDSDLKAFVGETRMRFEAQP